MRLPPLKFKQAEACKPAYRSNLDSDAVEDRSDHKARASSLSLARAFLFRPDMPNFYGTLSSYSRGAYVSRLYLTALFPTFY